MPEIIQDWLGTRLGILLDLTPQNFGKNTKDGVLLARLLYGYGVIPVHILQKIKESKNYYDCIENLKILRPWLRHIGVKNDDSTLQEVARGEGLSAISLFYAVYLNLERKDTLYYLLVQKERKFTADRCTRKLKVERVPEKVINESQGLETPSANVAFFEKNDMIEWHRTRCKEVVDKIQKVKSKFIKSKKRENKSLASRMPKKSFSQIVDKNLIEANEVNETLREFEKRHLQKCPDLTYSELIKLKTGLEVQPRFSMPKMDEAKSAMANIKHRKRSEIYGRNFQANMQYMVLDEQWNEIAMKQNKKLENIIHETLLKQSKIEKQMMGKLCQIRNQKKVFAENRKLIESLKTEQRSRELDDELIMNVEMKESYRSNQEFEKERLSELHKKVYSEKLKARRKFIKAECESIIQSISDIALRISEIRRLTSCQIPKSLIKDLKELFFKNLPIFDVLDNYEELFTDDVRLSEGMEEDNEGEGDVVYDGYNQMKIEERHRQNILNEADFEDYMNLMGPWMCQLLFPEDSDTDPKIDSGTHQVVLGYVVHKLLEVKYPIPNHPTRVSLKPMLPKAVVQDLEGDAYKMLVDIMEANKIFVVHVGEAINFVLSAYKEELAVVRDIDITFQNLTSRALQSKEGADKDQDLKKKVVLMKKEETTNRIEGSEPNSLHKETQTPRKIPEDDPLLSTNATIGKMAFEALGAGDPVPDIVIVFAIVAYVESKQDDLDGWVLVNYPRLYSQASELECALTGYRLLPLNDRSYETLEDIEGFSFREPCVSPFSRDDFVLNRTSRLVPKPDFGTKLQADPKTYFNAFIKLKAQSDSSTDETHESNSTTAMQEFYINQNVFHLFEYSTLDFQTVKNIGKIILKEKFKNFENDDANLMPKTSQEFFGSAIIELNDKWDLGKKKIAKASEKTTDGDSKKIKPKETGSMNETFEPMDGVVQTATFPEVLKSVGKKSVEPQSPPARPGDPEWEWATGNQPDFLLTALASIWENMEAAFVDDIKDVFFCLRTHRSNVLSYCEFVRKSVQNVMRQPDDKQKVLSDFKQMFNDIDFDLRPDLDIKCELHVRVSELEEVLLGIADERRANSLKDISKVTQDGWVADEMANLVNHFLSIVQLETDRSLTTCQILNDYYASIQQRLPDEKVIGRITVAKLQIKDRKYSILSSSPQKSSSSQIYTPRNSDYRRSNRVLADQGTRSNFERISKTRSWTEKRRKSSDMSFLTGASEIITEILINLTLPVDGITPFHNFIRESIQSVTTEVTNVMEGYISEARKGDKSAVKNPKKGSETNTMPGGNASLEWDMSLTNELSRFLFRAKIILARGIFDVNELLTTILNILSSLTDEINEMYLKEVKSISECCKVLRCCIEEEIPIPLHLVLKEDDFYIEDDISISKEDGCKHGGVEKEDKIHFSTNQLFLLFEKLHRVAPDGEIIKRSLIYILEDLRGFNPQIKTCNCLPEVWRSLDPNDIIYIMDQVYQDLEIVHWKDFIIYALEIPAPTENEILSMRKLFREFDPHLTELVTRCDYDKINFWFENSNLDCEISDKMELKKNLLFKMYQVDDFQTNYSALLLAFCKDENPIFGLIKALTLVMGKKINANEYATEDFLFIEGEGGQVEENELFESYQINDLKKPPSFTENHYKCIPKKSCACTKNQKNNNSQNSIGMSFSDTWVSERAEQGEGEADSCFYCNYKEAGGENVVSSVPVAILTSLFKVSFPFLPQLSILLDCKQTFQDTLNSIYDSLESQNDQIEVYKLLRHKFVSSVVHSTNKFKFVKLQEIVLNRLKSKNLLGSPLESLDQDRCSFSVD